MGDGAYPEWQPLDLIEEAKLMQRKFSKDEENPGATREGLLHGRASKLSREATKLVVEDAWGLIWRGCCWRPTFNKHGNRRWLRHPLESLLLSGQHGQELA